MNFNSIDNEFLFRFPGGFDDPQWAAGEKKYGKTKKINEILDTELSEIKMEELIEYGEFSVIAESVLKLIRTAAIISVFEKVAFSNFVKERDTHEPLALALYDLLYHFDENSFEQMVGVLGMYKQDKSMNVLKWPILTIFNSYRDPNNHVLVKPNTVKAISKAVGYDISYTPRPNYSTYTKILNMVKDYRDSSNICKDRNLRTAETVMYIAIH